MGRSTIPAAAIVAVWLVVTTAQAQLFRQPQSGTTVRVEEAGNTERSHLEQVSEFLADGQWDTAVETLRALMENHGDALVRLPGQPRYEGYPGRLLPMRQVCQMRLCGLKAAAPEALALYRSRVDPAAERLVRQGIAERDAEMLERVVEQMLATSFGDDALYALGELALEQGQFARARGYWERISRVLRPRADEASDVAFLDGRSLWLALKDADGGAEFDSIWPRIEPLLTDPAASAIHDAYPDTDLNLSDVRARLVLVSILEGSRDRAAWELEVFRRLHGDAEGTLAGRRSKYTELLAALLKSSADWRDVAAGVDWPTFGGSPHRGKIAPQGIDVGGPPVWSHPLPLLEAHNEKIGFGRQRIAEEFNELLPYHPVVAGDLVFVNELTCLKVLRLSSGAPAWSGADDSGIVIGRPYSKEEADKRYPRSRYYVGVPRFTATVSGERLFARVGTPLTAIKSNPALMRQPGMIVGLDLAAEGKLLPGFPLEVDDRRWAFEGSPLCDGDNLYVAMRRTDEGSPQSACYVACFDATTGARRWRRMVCESSIISQANTDEISHVLLTLSEGTLYCNTNLGVVAALSPRDGSMRWVVEYPRCSFPATDLESEHLHFFRDLNPCVVHRGIVLAAPSDSDHILAIDATTGQALWQTPRPQADDVVHLLGVGHGNLIASGQYLYWFDVATGRQVGQFPQQRSQSPGAAPADPPGYGRGVLAGDCVYWPTREIVYVFEQRTRRVDRTWEPIGVREIELTHRGATGGNLLIAGGVLLIAAGDRLVAFGEAGGNVGGRDD